MEKKGKKSEGRSSSKKSRSDSKTDVVMSDSAPEPDTKRDNKNRARVKVEGVKNVSFTHHKTNTLILLPSGCHFRTPRKSHRCHWPPRRDLHQAIH